MFLSIVIYYDGSLTASSFSLARSLLVQKKRHFVKKKDDAQIRQAMAVRMNEIQSKIPKNEAQGHGLDNGSNDENVGEDGLNVDGGGHGSSAQ